jgi:hypothetical protein
MKLIVLCGRPLEKSIARQLLLKEVSAATNTHVRVENFGVSISTTVLLKYVSVAMTTEKRVQV